MARISSSTHNFVQETANFYDIFLSTSGVGCVEFISCEGFACKKDSRVHETSFDTRRFKNISKAVVAVETLLQC